MFAAMLSAVLFALVASAHAAPPPSGDQALFWAIHRAHVALLEETEGYRSQTAALMVANEETAEALAATVAERRAMLDELAAARAKMAADTEAAGFDPAEQLAIHDAAVARMEALMPKNLGTVLRFKLELLEQLGGDLEEYRYLGDLSVAGADALPADDVGILLLGVASGIGKLGDTDATLRYAGACTEICPDDFSKVAAWYMLMIQYARNSDRAASRAAALALLAYPEEHDKWTSDARDVVAGTRDLDPNAPVPVDPEPVTPEEPAEPDEPGRKKRDRLDEPGSVMLRAGPTYDLGTHRFAEEPVTHFSGYTLGYGVLLRHVGFDAQFKHDGWSVAEPTGTLELRTNRLEIGITIDLLGFSTDRRLRPTLGPYGAIGLGWGRDTHLAPDGIPLSEEDLLAFGVVYGAKAGLGTRLGDDLLLELQVRASSSPYLLGTNAGPLDYPFTRAWELQTALAIGTQVD
jgi:hypothetical protein